MILVHNSGMKSLAAGAVIVALTVAAAAQNAINVPFEKYTLPNGLTVVLAQNRATPLVAVEVIYHVGSKNEVAGRTGFAHMFEHVMFTGSGHVPYGYHDKFTEGVGGGNNGTTSSDWTIYYETVPSNYLETALWLESDRWDFLLDSLETRKFRGNATSSKNERRQNTDNEPYARENELLGNTMYPKGHPYSWPTIGSMPDLGKRRSKTSRNSFASTTRRTTPHSSSSGISTPRAPRRGSRNTSAPFSRGAAIVRPNDRSTLA